MYERGRGWGQERGREIFQLISEKEKKSKISGAQVCFFFQENFAEAMFLKCTFYKVYQIFSYLKPNVNRNL